MFCNLTKNCIDVVLLVDADVRFLVFRVSILFDLNTKEVVGVTRSSDLKILTDPGFKFIH